MNFNRVHIIGTPGAGKTTLARRLAAGWDVPFVELDSLFWGAHWLPAATDVFRRRVSAATRQHNWVMCGNHATARDLIWARADGVIWLDYANSLGTRRLIQRATQKLSHNLREWLQHKRKTHSLISHDSLLLFALRARAERRTDFSQLLAQQPFAHLQVLRFTKPNELEHWLQKLDVQNKRTLTDDGRRMLA